MHWIALGRGELEHLEFSRIAEFLGNKFGYLIVTGDGHAHPSFDWISKVQTEVRHHLLEAIRFNRVCAYVEQFEHSVRAADLPPLLQPIYHQEKLFGWEPEIFKYIAFLLEEILGILKNDRFENDNFDLNLIAIYQILPHISRLAYTINQDQFIRDRVRYFSRANVSGWDEDTVKMRLNSLSKELMMLRTDKHVHRAIAKIIGGKMREHEQHCHLISVGNAHLLNNNICRFIAAENVDIAVGIVDVYTGGMDFVF